MNYQFSANHISVEDDGYTKIVAFADDELSPSKFIILQKANAHDENERAMGMDKIHIQIEDQSRSRYGGINAIRMSGQRLKIFLSEEARLSLRLDGDIEIDIDSNHPNLESALSELKKICELGMVDFLVNDL